MRAFTTCLLLVACVLVPPALGLEILVVPTIQYAHADLWARTPGARGPRSTAVGQVVRDQPVHILIFATGFATGPDQTSEVSYRATFVRPDGTNGTVLENLKLIAREPGRDPRKIYKAAELTAFVATKDDPLGEWRVIIEATDRIDSGSAKSEQRFTVAGNEVLTAALPDGEQRNHWFARYHENPAPQQLLAAVKFVAELPPVGDKPRPDAKNGPWLGFFEQALADNPWLLPHVIARLEQATGRERELLGTLLAYAKRADAGFARTLPAAVRGAVDSHRDEKWPVPAAEPMNGDQLDVLWGRFFASGRYQPIRELVGVLDYLPYKDAVDEYKKQEPKPGQPGPEVMKSAVFKAASWSLRSNIQQDKVVRDYCEGILIRKELPEPIHLWLAGLFRLAVQELQKNAPVAAPAGTGEAKP